MLKLPETDTHFRGLKKVNGYQRGALFHALAFVKQWNVAVDVGAHVGYITKDIAPLFQKVYAFEPRTDNYRCLVENTPSNADCIRAAIGDKECWGHMETPLVSNSGAWQFVECDDEKIDVMMRTLDSYDLAPDFIKIDVQGMEMDVLRGARKTLKNHHPVILIETMMDGVENQDIFKYLAELDYDFSVKTGKNTVFVWKQASRVAI